MQNFHNSLINSIICISSSVEKNSPVARLTRFISAKDIIEEETKMDRFLFID